MPERHTDTSKGCILPPHTKGYIVGHASNSLAMNPEAGNGDEGH